MNSEKKILILSNFLEPMNQIAAVRLRGIIKHLLEMGWQIFIVSTTNTGYDYHSDEVYGQCRVYPASSYQDGFDLLNKKAIENHPVFKWACRILGWNMIKKFKNIYKSMVNMEMLGEWSGKAYKISMDVIDKHGIGYVFSTVPYIQSMNVGARIKKTRSSIVHICEFRDLISMNKILTREQWFVEADSITRWEKKNMPYVDKFIFLTDAIKATYLDYYSSINPNIEKGLVLTNGYDKDSYPAATDRRDGKFIINHTGNLYGSRSPVPFVQAVIKLLNEQPEYKSRVMINFIGELDFNIKRTIARLCNEHKVTNINVLGLIPHDEALKFMVDSDLNLLITHSKGSEYAIPGKLFEYMGAGRNIFALTDDILVRKMMREKNLGWICSNQQDEIYKTLGPVLAQWKKNNYCLEVNYASTSEYERANIVKQMGHFITSRENLKRVKTNNSLMMYHTKNV